MTALKYVICVLAIVLAACASGASEVPLTMLADKQDVYDGRAVSTRGSVLGIEDPRGAGTYYVLEDNAGNRVRLLPDASARPFADESVVVTGTFRFDPNAGRELHVETIEPSQ